MSPKLHYYNPGHETVVLEGKAHYTPSVNVCKLQKDLALLPAWYASAGDYVYVENPAHSHHFSTLPEEIRPPVALLFPDSPELKAGNLPAMEASPWGISPQSIHLYHQLNKKYGLNIDVPEWNDEYVRLTGRQTAAQCLQKIKSLLPDMELPPVPLFFDDPEHIARYITANPDSYLVKTPYSSSGRGLLWLYEGELSEKDKNWIKGAIKKQGSVSLEPILNRWRDFALEFYSDGKGTVEYKGISMFDTNKRGAYEGNKIECQFDSQEFFQVFIGEETFRKVKDTVALVIQDTYSSLYKGCIGVDMFLYHDRNSSIAIHPCVEINMRYTMGMLAIRIFEQYVHEKAAGIFHLIYENDPLVAYQAHLSHLQHCPPTIKDGKLKTGYIPLCPVTEETNYMAYVIVR